MSTWRRPVGDKAPSAALAINAAFPLAAGRNVLKPPGSNALKTTDFANAAAQIHDATSHGLHAAVAAIDRGYHSAQPNISAMSLPHINVSGAR